MKRTYGFYDDAEADDKHNRAKITKDGENTDADDESSSSSSMSPVQWRVSDHLEPVHASLFGHDNRETFLKEIAFFNDDFVVTGSDCGNLFM